MTTPQGQLRINTKYHWLTFMLAGFKPRASINGHEVQLNWGENVLPAPLGQHQVEVHVPYLWKFGKAAITVDNSQAVPVLNYAAPVWTWQRGAIGYEPQKHPGLTAAWIVYGLFFLGLVVCCIGTVLAGGNGN
ncbi:MAG TPA: hypothetical protein DGT23_27680 [Micromonosporaceae bacterium]|nr:hypothetical protein [Micromonosporaceae bacterium]